MVDIVNTPEEGNAQEVDAPQSDIPEQFQGKSPQELVEMYRNLERKFGQQSEEVGQLRKLADEKLLSPASSEQDELNEVDFYSDPEKAIERIIERKLRPFQEVANAQSFEVTTKKLSSEFPGWEDTVKSSEFEEWVAKSKVRIGLYKQANAADYDAAAELLSTWNDLGNSKANRDNSDKKAVERDRKLRAVTTEKGSAGIDPRKILNASDLRSLMQTNPSRYKDLLPDIRKAYAEGRVKR